MTVLAGSLGVLGQSSRVPAFSPLALSPSLWLDSTEIAGSDLSAVATWADKSGNGSDVTQATADYRPALQVPGSGNRSIRFDGTNDHLTRPSKDNLYGQYFTLIIAAKWFNGPANYDCFAQKTMNNSWNTGWGLHYDGGNMIGWIKEWNGANGGSTITRPVVTGQWHLCLFRVTPTGLKLKVGSSETSNAFTNGDVTLQANSQASPLYIGGGNHGVSGVADYKGPAEFGDVLFWNSALSDVNTGLVETYLKTKWGIA